MSYGEPIALREQAEIEGIAIGGSTAASGEARSWSEAQFIERLRQGEAAAFEQLVSERSGEIFAVLLRLTEDAEEARDLTQETFLQAFRHVKDFRGEANLKTWLYRIAINEARNRRRWWQRRRRPQTVSLDNGDENSSPGEQLQIEDGADNPEQSTLQRERERLLLKALGALTRPFREVVVLRDIEEMSYEEVAHTLEINVGTVKSRLARARAEMRRRLEGSL